MPFHVLCFAALAPLWFRVGTSSGNEPAFLSVFVRHRASPYYTHANVTADGLRKGAVPQGGRKAQLQPRTYTPWMDMREIMQDGRKLPRERFCVRMIRRWDVPLTNSAFVVEFSTDATNLYKRLIRKGPGSGLYFAVDAEEDGGWRIVQDAEGAKAARTTAEALPRCGGRAPTLFPVSTGFAVDRDVAMPSVVEDELAVLHALGLNGLKGREYDFPFCRLWSPVAGEYPHQDRELLRRKALEWGRTLGSSPGSPKAVLVNTGDETSVGPEHATNCTVCAGKVPGGPTLEKSAGERYYRTMRTVIDATTEGLRATKDAVGEVLPDVPVAINNGISLLFCGNLATSGVDWFSVYGTGALTYGWGEDWANFGRTKQINSLYWDAMRAACLTRNTPFGFYDILAHNGWEIRAKAFSAVGRGARSLHYFNYGPWYTTASDSQSARPEVLAAIREVNFALGTTEREILAAHCAKGDAAILVGLTGDIWMVGEDSEYGMEREAMSLLLRHCNVRTDVLGEDQVAERLKEYPMLFVLDRNVRRDVAKTILDWVGKGGRLYLGPNAMTMDEANEPLALGFERTAYVKNEKVGRPKFELVKRKELDRYEGMRVIVGSSKPYFEERTAGRGKVLAFGFFPGLDYWGTATANANRFGMLEYPTAHRDFFAKKVLRDLPLRCETSDPLVEIHLLEGPKADVLAFANWSGASTETAYVVRRPDGTVQKKGRIRLEVGGFEVLRRQ